MGDFLYIKPLKIILYYCLEEMEIKVIKNTLEQLKVKNWVPTNQKRCRLLNKHISLSSLQQYFLEANYATCP